MEPVVNLSEKCSLRGKCENLGIGVPNYAFLGVPYAEQPVGDLRFQLCQPLQLWEEEITALKYGKYSSESFLID